jgi:hypothetical protein
MSDDTPENTAEILEGLQDHFAGMARLTRAAKSGARDGEVDAAAERMGLRNDGPNGYVRRSQPQYRPDSPIDSIVIPRSRAGGSFSIADNFRI